MGKARITSLLLLTLYIIAVCILCFAKIDTGIDMSSTWLGFPKDKVVHFLMFLPYPILTSLSFRCSNGKPWSFILFMLVIIVIGIAIGAATELIQGTTGYRSCDINDLKADSLGILAGSIIVLIYVAVSRKW